MLRSEGVWTLSQRLDSPGRKGLDNGPTIRSLSRKDSIQKIGIPTLQDARLSCGKRMVCAAVRRDLNTESVIRLLGRKDLDTKLGTLTLQDARLLCDKRMAYATV